MRLTCNMFKTLTAGAAIALFTPAALADMHGDQHGEAQGQQQTDHHAQNMDHQAHGKQASLEDAVSAESLLEADVRNVMTSVGNVRDLILNEQGDAVEYVLYEVPYPYSLQNAQNGFAAFDNLAIEPGASLDVRFDDEAAAKAPEELTITRREADNRMVTRLLDSTVEFSDAEQSREIEDVLIDRNSGKIVGYVVNREPDAWFNDQPVMIEPDQVTIKDDGNVTTRAEFAALESLKQ